MDSIMEKNLKTFAEGFMKQQEDYAEKISEVDRLKEAVEAAAELINLAWLLIYDTKDMTDSERVEKIGNAINIFYDKYGDPNI